MEITKKEIAKKLHTLRIEIVGDGIKDAESERICQKLMEIESSLEIPKETPDFLAPIY